MITIPNITTCPLTGLPRTLTFHKLYLDEDTKTLRLFWRLSIIRLDGSESADSADHEQKADNETFVDMETLAATGQVQLLTQQQLDEMYPPPQVMGEYDFWWYMTDNDPQPIRLLLVAAGQQFAERNNWL